MPDQRSPILLELGSTIYGAIAIISAKKAKTKKKSSLRFEGTTVDSLFAVLDAVAWLDLPDVSQISQFAGIDARTAGKVLKNCRTMGMVEAFDDAHYSVALAYPYKGSIEQKNAVVKEALVRMPLLQNVRQFLLLGETLEDSLRKAATIQGVTNYDPKAIAPLVRWAKELDALSPEVGVEDLIDSAVAQKKIRHRDHKEERVVFLSHSSKDKPFVRKLATDLKASGVQVWLDELHILVGDSIPERIAQGLAASDAFIIVLSEHSIASPWVQKELDTALMDEISNRGIRVLPAKLDDSDAPALLQSKKYADFTKSYKLGLSELEAALNELENEND